MPKNEKARSIYDMSMQSTLSLTKDTHNWTSYLNTASRLYKYSFADNVLIHVQRPDATACADFEIWNTVMHRYVNRGATGIALLDDKNGQVKIKYVFDVSDTNGKANTKPKPWMMKLEYEQQVIQELENHFGSIDETLCDLGDQLMAFATNAADDNYIDYLKELSYATKNSNLEELDELNVEAVFKSVLTASVAYTLLSRCGLDPMAYLSAEDFQGLNEFNTVPVITRLGNATCDISHLLLRQIERTVKSIERNKDTLAKVNNLRNSIVEDKQERTVEGDDGADIQASGRLSDTRPDDTRANENAFGQIRAAAQELSQNEQEGLLPDAPLDGRTDESPVRAGQTSPRASGSTDESIAGYTSSTGQSNRSDGVDKPYEQPQTHSRGDHPRGTDLQLGLFPVEQEQRERITEAEDEKASAFTMSQEDIDEILLSGSGVQNGKARTSRFFQENVTAPERMAFLKKEYGIGGGTKYFSDGNRGSEWHDGKGIRITKNIDGASDIEVTLPWTKVQKRIGELVAAGRYLSDSSIESMQKPITPLKEYRFTYKLGDTVYLEDDHAFLIEDIGINNMRLRDLSFPILSRAINIEEFERLLNANSRNAENLQDEEELRDVSESSVALLDSTEQEDLDELDIGQENLLHRDAQQPINKVDSPLEYENNALPEISNEKITTTQAQPTSSVANYRITDDALGQGGAKTKFNRNIDAIRLLQLIEGESRQAIAEEQESLAQYVGWGGLAQAFDEGNTQWSKEYQELRELLTENEYNAARASTLNAHYTSPIVIKAIYSALENMGFQTGNILEPSCGVGNFFGMLPDSMSRSKLYGVELDSITGRIAKQLYPKANIAVQGFESIDLPDSFFDVAIGNVPFGSYTLPDKRYDKYSFLIHDYFFAKTLDKVRPGGIIAFITSKGTMDKQNPQIRRYIAQRAELLGAIRLHNDAFKANAGTEVTTDILFLQKRDRSIDIEPDWVHLGQTDDGIPVNSYFVTYPEMILGQMTHEVRQYGSANDTTCKPFEGVDFAQQLKTAMQSIQGRIDDYELEEDQEQEPSIPADPNVRNFSFTVVDDAIYYRENSRMNKLDIPVTAENRIRGLIELRDCVRGLIYFQLNDYSNDVIENEQQRLNDLYDNFTQKYGLINSPSNSRTFCDDSSYCLLCSLEVLDENGELERKADMFTKRTIRQHSVVTSVDTPSEALAVSIADKACVDLEYMSRLLELEPKLVAEQLKDIIFLNPSSSKWETADEYLSGNVREKLKIAKQIAQTREGYDSNVSALEAVQPKDLTAGEIDVRLGATWIDADVVKQFMFELLNTPRYLRWNINVHFSNYTAAWNIEGKNKDRTDNIHANVTYGTNRINAYKIIEESLNLKDVRIFDTVEDAEGNKKQVLNKKETTLAQQKQESIRAAFKDWIFKEQSRREHLVRLYNDTFNAIRPREYDGRHIRFSGINPEITLRKHQINAIAHILYGKNTLLAHVVGAGKSATRS